MKKDFSEHLQNCTFSGMPEWLPRVANNKNNIKIEFKDFLDNSCFYYCAGRDITPIIALEEKIFTYILCDTCELEGKNYSAFIIMFNEFENRLIKQGFKKNTNLGEYKLFENYFNYKNMISHRPWEMILYEKNGFYYCIWYLFCEDYITYNSLYVINEMKPTVICNINPENSKMLDKYEIGEILPEYVIGHTYGNEKYIKLKELKYYGDYSDNAVLYGLYDIHKGTNNN